MRLSKQQTLSHIATVFGLGRIKVAPGTFGSIAALPLAYGLSLVGVGPYALFMLVLFPVAVWAAEAHSAVMGEHDSQTIIIDEVLGMLISLFWLPMTWQTFAIGFLLFRLLDITKPFPISVLDRKVTGGIGVIIDDVAAGVVVNVILQILLQKTMLLGLQSITISS